MQYTYNSKRYKKWRERIFVRDHFTCQLCGVKGTLNAHHIKKKSRYPSLAHKIQNGVSLCVKCHDIITGTEEVFEPLFFRIIQEKLTTDFIYKFFYTLTQNHKDLVKKFKAKDKWLKIPHFLIELIQKWTSKK